LTKEKIKASSLEKLTLIASKQLEDSWVIDLIESELKTKIPDASLEDLLVAKSKYESRNEPKTEIVELFNKFISQEVKKDADTLSLNKIVGLMTNHEDKNFVNLIEPSLKEKISNAKLEDLLAAKSKYKWMDEQNESILKHFNNSITQQFKSTSFDDLLDQRSNWDEIVNELIDPILKNNIPAVIDKFAKSGNFESAGSNSFLLVKAAKYLSPTQWENILEAFFQNDQLYYSYSCYGGFESLFKKSLELSNFVQPYWLTFRQKLNNLNNKHSNSLKRLIDSHARESG
jgi:hypothetical protein